MEITQLLKSDVFGRIRRVGDAVVREADYALPWARALARHLMRREHRALSRLALGDGIEGIPRVLDLHGMRLTRTWIDGAPMQIAKPRDPAYFRAALRLLRRVHAANEALTASGSLPALDQARVLVEPPRDASHGDMATNAAMVLAKAAG